MTNRERAEALVREIREAFERHKQEPTIADEVAIAAIEQHIEDAVYAARNPKAPR